MLLLEEQILGSFDFFSIKTGNYYNYTYKLCKGEDKVILKFINFIRTTYGEISIGKHWLFDYFCFQFEYWRTKNIKYKKGGGIIELSWVIGDKAILRWKNRVKDYQYFYKTGLLKYSSLTKGEYFSLFEQEKREVLNKKNIIDLERERFFNKDNGFLHCFQFAYYNSNSKLCKICKFRSKCKDIKK